MQVAAFAKLTNNKEQIDFCTEFYKTELLPNQMADDGSFPKELDRTKPYGYSLFNLDAMTALVQLLTTCGEEGLFQYSRDSKSIEQGIHYIFPYIKNKSSWPHENDVMYWEDWPSKHSFLLFSGLQLNKSEYISTYKELPEVSNKNEVLRNMPVRYPLIWLEH